MDVKNNKNTRLMEKLKLETLDDFKNLTTMLQASKEDFEVAVKITATGYHMDGHPGCAGRLGPTPVKRGGRAQTRFRSW